MNVEEKARGIFSRFTQTLAKVDLKNAVAIPALIGAATAIAGCALEAHGQAGLLQHGGLDALQAYKDALVQMPFMDFLRNGIEGKLQSFGGNTQARGMTLMAAAPVISVASVALARGLEKLRTAISDHATALQNTGSELVASVTQAAAPAARPRMKF